MANELTRVSDRLTRARQQLWNGATRAWLPPPARREPIPRDPLERQRDAGAEQKRPPVPLVAIHVEVHNHTGPTREVIDAQSAEFDDAELADFAAIHEARYAQEAAARAVAQLPPPPAASSQPFFALPAVAAASDGKKQARTGSIFHYFAARAINAYLSQRRFANGATHEPRMLDLRA